jgi:hypothetical protein
MEKRIGRLCVRGGDMKRSDRRWRRKVGRKAKTALDDDEDLESNGAGTFGAEQDASQGSVVEVR